MEYIAGAITTALVTWFIASRRFSGKIDSSEARDLWNESASIRQWSQGRIEALEKENTGLREEISELRGELTWSRERIAVLENRLDVKPERS